MVLVLQLYDVLFLNSDDYHAQAHTKLHKQKKMWHTRMYTIFRTLSSQYSRRLLSILAQLMSILAHPHYLVLNISSLT